MPSIEVGWHTTTPDTEQPFPSEAAPSAPPAPNISTTPTGPAAAEKPLNPLAADQFLPIDRDEIKQGASRGSLWNPWFGRRDLIPPADDDRTRLIDRGMVTEGILTPEQLVEMHEVGTEMERLRPTMIGIETQAYRAGQAAIEADREQREAIRKQKKLEAEDRKRRRAEEIAHRRATDIIFLGRGVSSGLAERASDEQKLSVLGLPYLNTPADVANALELTISRLRWLAFHTEVAPRIHYIQFEVPKRSGGTRTLSAPHETLTNAQRWILDNVVSTLSNEPCAHGFLPKKSILSNAQCHVGQAVVLNMDLEGFFPSVTFPRVRGIFRQAGYSPAVATILALLTTECPRRKVEFAGQEYFVATGPRGLPQGACTSPALSNQVARKLDRRLTGLARKLSITYTRYADDLTFSGDAHFNDRVGYVIACVRHIAQQEGFEVNARKTRVFRRNTAQYVTGLVVNDRPSLSRKELRQLRAILHRAQREGLERQNRDGRPNFAAWLRGKIAYVRMVRPEIGVKLQQQLDAVL